MTDEQPPVTATKRSRREKSSARSEALERLKSIRSGGRRSTADNGSGGYDIKIENPIFDAVSDDEYDALVARRREENRDFIVDDDGLGYGDEGEEEDWSKSALPQSSDESDEDGRFNNSSRKKKAQKKEKDPTQQQPKKSNSSLTAAAAMMGKQRISSMFTSTVFKKSKETDKVKCESIVDEVIAEYAPDETDRERRRRGKVSSHTIISVKSEVQVVKDSVNLMSSRKETGQITANNESYIDSEEKNEIVEEKEPEKEIKEENELIIDHSQEAVVEPIDSVSEDRVEESVLAEIKTEPLVKESLKLNAKINIEKKDPAFSATAGWKAVRTSGNENGNTSDFAEMKTASRSEERSDFDLETDGSLPFYIIDAYEEPYGINMGTLYLFGKVKVGNTYHSCCVVVKNMQRCVYAIPNECLFPTDDIMKLEVDAEESRIPTATFRSKLHEMASSLKNEIAQQLSNSNISSFSMTPVKRTYAFERTDIPAGKNYVVKINYSFKDPPVPADLKGETFCALLGTHTSALELFLIKRKVKGPTWLSVSNFSRCPSSPSVSWCKFEVTVDTPKDVHVSSSKTLEIPPLVVSAINLKTIINEKQNVNEIVSASVICCHKAKIDTPTLSSEWKRPGMLSHFTVVRKVDGIFPMGFSKEVAERNIKANVLASEMNERALLTRLMVELHKLDSDVLVGHNISGFDLDVLLHRAQACKVPYNMWSKIGRLKRSKMPNLGKGSTIFGSGASPGIMSCIAGRLLCDTYLCSRDLLKEVSYSLTQLAKTQLKKDRKEIAPHALPKMFQTSESLMELIEYGETDAWLSMELMFHLSVLPLTRQLTNISGNLWGKTLQGARAQRVEYLLLHAFHAKKYIVPDKISFHSKEKIMTKRKMSNGVEGKKADGLDADDANIEYGDPQNDHEKGKKGPAYSGGLVLEPKKGLYDKYILLLDFNSLYPSIIQEYNICFTTVQRSQDGLVPNLPSSKTTGVLPELLKNLVQRRRMVKSWMKTATGLRIQQLDIQQQALKLTANSMYGCLGFSNSRFYAKPLAELITLQGREILQSTVDLVQNNLGLEVIYGDTDSIMIYSGLDDTVRAKAIAAKVIQEVNKKYRCLEIDLDGMYKRMLLLKKKKYAAVKVQVKDGTTHEVIERKGLDIVRRDWSILSKDLGDFCLSQILSGGSCEDVVESIHSSLMKVQEEMRSGQVPLEKYVITKTLTKPPEAYPDARNQPHVQVALRLKQAGYSTGCAVGDTIPYIICCEMGTIVSGSSGIAQRARHPDELKVLDGKWMIDIDYYLSQQIHPVVSRLCASIQGTSPERLADCLGLDSTKFRTKPSEASEMDPSSSLLFAVEDEERYRGCEPLILSCPSCSNTFECPPIFNSIYTSINNEKQPNVETEQLGGDFWRKMRCPKCPEGDIGKLSPGMIANQVKRQTDGFVSTYYKCIMVCDDESCKHTTRAINLRVVGDADRGTMCPNYPRCIGRLVRKYTEAELYKQLTYFCHLLDTEHNIDKVESKIRLQLEKELGEIRSTVNLAVSTVKRIRDRCAYGWVKFDLFNV